MRPVIVNDGEIEVVLVLGAATGGSKSEMIVPLHVKIWYEHHGTKCCERVVATIREPEGCYCYKIASSLTIITKSDSVRLF